MHIMFLTLVGHQVFLVQLEVVSGETLCALTLLCSYLWRVGIDPLWCLIIIHHVCTFKIVFPGFLPGLMFFMASCL